MPFNTMSLIFKHADVRRVYFAFLWFLSDVTEGSMMLSFLVTPNITITNLSIIEGMLKFCVALLKI